MSEITKSPRDFVGYEYKELTAPSDKFSLYLDGYENFGWSADLNVPQRQEHGLITVTVKRDRRIVNKTELTRLQRNFDACVREIEALERSKTTRPMALALSVGVLGTVFMALSIFAVTAQTPHIAVCILFGVPGIAGWVAPIFIYQRRLHQKIREIDPLIEEKLEEAYRLCERGHQLLPR